MLFVLLTFGGKIQITSGLGTRKRMCPWSGKQSAVAFVKSERHSADAASKSKLRENGDILMFALSPEKCQNGPQYECGWFAGLSIDLGQLFSKANGELSQISNQ